MPSYSIARAKEQLSRLVDEALTGETVTITRHGKPVAELRATAPVDAPTRMTRADLDWLRKRRDARPPLGDDAATLIRKMREEKGSSFYLDANVLVALFVADAHSKTVDADPGDLFVSDFARTEFAAVLSRQLRVGAMDDSDAREALADFDEWAARVTFPVETGARDMSLANCLVRDFATKLAAPDALHLALASNRGHRLATFDARLAEAATLRGVEVAALG